VEVEVGQGLVALLEVEVAVQETAVRWGARVVDNHWLGTLVVDNHC
jgi:hypothetical protein